MSRWKIDNASRFFYPAQVARFYFVLIPPRIVQPANEAQPL
jgi:hypothetical protein